MRTLEMPSLAASPRGKSNSLEKGAALLAAFPGKLLNDSHLLDSPGMIASTKGINTRRTPVFRFNHEYQSEKLNWKGRNSSAHDMNVGNYLIAVTQHIDVIVD